MSQSGFTPIQLYRSATPGAVPLAGNLAPGELAINTADQKLFFENASGTVVASVPFNTTGVLDVANGGTGASTLTSGYLLKGNGTSAVSSSVLYENGGYLGIGTTGPAVLFDAQQTLNGSGGISYTNLSTGASSAASITAEAGGSYLTLNVTRATGVVQFRGVTATTLNQDFNTQIFRSTGGSEYMRVTSAGNLGLGTSAPVGRLMVAAADTSNTIGSATASINITNTDAGATGRTSNLNFTVDDGNLTTRRLATISAVYTGFGGGGTEGALAFATQFNGSLSERMRISSAGNVGIGTTAPGYKLDVSATGNISGQFKTSGSINALFLADAGTTAESLYVGTVGNDFRVVTGSNERMRVTSAGAVAIGTSTPGGGLKLDVSGNGRFIGNLDIFSAVGGAVNSTFLYFGSASLSNAAAIYSKTDTGTAGNLILATAQTGTGTITERLRVDSSGNVGIGTSAPVHKLEVSGSLCVDGFSNPATNYISLRSGFAPSVSGGVGFTAEDHSGSSSDGLGCWGQDGIRFSTAQVERMRIDSSGYLLVGATSSVGVGAVRTQIGSAASVASGFVLKSTTASISLYASSGTGSYQSWPIGGFMAFGAGPTDGSTFAEAMRIDSNGNLFVGTTASLFSNSVRLEVLAPANNHGTMSTVSTAAYQPYIAHNSATAGDNNFMAFGTEAAYTGRGGISYNRAGGLVAYNTTSDYRAKEVFGPVENPGATIDSLKVYTGKMLDATQSRPMLIAHEAQAVAPYAVTGEKDAVNEDGTPRYQQMDTSALVPLLIAEVQSLRARVAQLEGK